MRRVLVLALAALLVPASAAAEEPVWFAHGDGAITSPLRLVTGGTYRIAWVSSCGGSAAFASDAGSVTVGPANDVVEAELPRGQYTLSVDAECPWSMDMRRGGLAGSEPSGDTPALVSTPLPAPTIRPTPTPRPMSTWTQDASLSWRWLDPIEYSCDWDDGCWGMLVTASAGCPDNLYVELSVTDRNDVVLGFTNDTSGAVAPGQSARLVFENLTGAGERSARPTEMSCY